MYSLAFGSNLQPRFATLRIFVRWRVQSYLPRKTALVYIAVPLASTRKRALMFNREAEGGGLLNRCRDKIPTGGSNPPLSAIALFSMGWTPS